VPRTPRDGRQPKNDGRPPSAPRIGRAAATPGAWLFCASPRCFPDRYRPPPSSLPFAQVCRSQCPRRRLGHPERDQGVAIVCFVWTNVRCGLSGAICLIARVAMHRPCPISPSVQGKSRFRSMSELLAGGWAHRAAEAEFKLIKAGTNIRYSADNLPRRDGVLVSPASAPFARRAKWLQSHGTAKCVKARSLGPENRPYGEIKCAGRDGSPSPSRTTLPSPSRNRHARQSDTARWAGLPHPPDGLIGGCFAPGDDPGNWPGRHDDVAGRGRAMLHTVTDVGLTRPWTVTSYSEFAPGSRFYYPDRCAVGVPSTKPSECAQSTIDRAAEDCLPAGAYSRLRPRRIPLHRPVPDGPIRARSTIQSET
jgi:hypothetical protein